MTLDWYWAKSPRRRGADGESLTAHLEATFQAAQSLAGRIGDLRCLDARLRKSFWRVVELAAIFHDAGKVATGFQAMVKGATRSWGQRHEVLSLGFVEYLVDDCWTRDWVSAAVATHHRPLAGIGEGQKDSLSLSYGKLRLDEFAEEIGDVGSGAAVELLGWLARTAGLPGTDVVDVDVVARAHTALDRLLTRWDPVCLVIGLSAVLLQGAVTLADHLSSAHGQLHSVQPVNAGFRNTLVADLRSRSRGIRAHQHLAARVDGHMILRAPTGSGKTEGGLLWAATQVERIGAERGCVPRLFYTLPYLASINAMAERLSRGLDRDMVGVAHSRAGSYHLAMAIEPEDRLDDGPRGRDRIVAAAHKAVSREAATRLFRETVRVGTPYQLLRGALAGPVHASVLLDTANSAFLLDELHAYDTRRLGFILAAMGVWEKLGGSIGVLSATMSEALIDLIRDSLEGEVGVIDGHGSDQAARHRVSLNEDHLTDERTVAEIRSRLVQGHSVLVVANNVAYAQELFAALAPTAESMHGPQGAHLLHARFKRGDRSAVEDGITKRYGTSATPRLGGLLVGTQTVEVSLDLDFDVLFTSGAPLEALLQRFGRVNRLGTRPPADVVVCQPEYRRRDGIEYADGVYPAEPTRHAWRILGRHHGQPVNERATVDWVNEVYSGGWGQTWRDDVQRHRKEFAEAFLTFTAPFDDRSGHEDTFDRLFEGKEAVLARDIDRYGSALAEAPGRAGRLLAEDLLIPLPHHATTTFDPQRRVNVVDAEYDSRTGLGPVRAAGPRTGASSRFLAGEIL